MKKLLVLFILFITVSAMSAESMVILKKGQIAPYDGIHLDSNQMKKFRKAHEEKELCVQKSASQKELIKIQELEKDYYMDKHSKLKDTHEKYKIKSFWAKTGYFLLGVVITGAISYGTMKYGPRR